MKIAIITDSWPPLTNGVVTTLTRMVPALEARGHQVLVIHPQLFKSIPAPTDHEIRLAILPDGKLARLLGDFKPDAIHLMIEGPLGWAAWLYCRRRGLPFTSSFTSKHAEIMKARIKTPVTPAYWLLRWFHSAAERTTVATPSLAGELAGRGFKNLVPWTRGVDTDLFRPLAKGALECAKPCFVYMGRIAAEKNIEAFLKLDLPGSKLIIGHGPYLRRLKRKYPQAIFVGRRTGQDLVAHLNSGDVFVFPSQTETFGVVLLEAMACGLPVAALPSAGPSDLIIQGETGWVDRDLGRAARKALDMDPAACRAHAMNYTWERCFDQFEAALAPITWPGPRGWSQ
jgi:glycosyltransferase involved in cell wall biosynthesis